MRCAQDVNATPVENRRRQERSIRPVALAGKIRNYGCSLSFFSVFLHPFPSPDTNSHLSGFNVVYTLALFQIIFIYTRAVLDFLLLTPHADYTPTLLIRFRCGGPPSSGFPAPTGAAEPSSTRTG
jgi:hypothetical protein